MLKAVRSANDRKEEAVIAIKHKISQVEGLKNKILAK